MRARVLAQAALLLGLTAMSSSADAWCRLTTRRASVIGECSSNGEQLMWCSGCSGMSPSIEDLPAELSLETFSMEATAATLRWAGVQCPGDLMDPPAFELRIIEPTRVRSGLNRTGSNANALWFNSEWRSDALHRSNTIAITIVSFDTATGAILDADIEFNLRSEINPDGMVFGTGDPTPGTADLGTILTHEMGHALGMGHSEFERAVMFPTAGTGERRNTPTEDDTAGLCDIYPLLATERRPQCDPPGATRRPDLVCNPVPYGGLAPSNDGGRVLGGCSVPSVRPASVPTSALYLVAVALSALVLRKRKPR
ncbi:MAG: matrixin family metalloprotease [Deltaproteobacteria bacterium]|nr:matrixin family metalloprotease [Deltaproteobacteria bacterium]